MSVILILIGASLFVAICFLIAFIWAVRSGQYEDKYTPAIRILFDDEVITQEKTNSKNVDNDTNQNKKSSMELTPEFDMENKV